MRPLSVSLFVSLCFARAALAAPPAVDFCYAPPLWQTAICLPDDPHKSLVDKSGELLYHYKQGGREFGTRVAVRLPARRSGRNRSCSRRGCPSCRTFRAAPGLEIVEEAFAVTGLRRRAAERRILVRVTNTGNSRAPSSRS